HTYERAISKLDSLVRRISVCPIHPFLARKDEYSVLILGLDHAGKTTYLEQTKTRFNANYKSMSLHKITSTVGLNSNFLHRHCDQVLG
uniref:ADP-ribosylation factor-related protein 1 n=1 Tax=Mesocestoides corti TaxID=53468 RepID=A0A5K3G0K3_MESCO